MARKKREKLWLWCFHWVPSIDTEAGPPKRGEGADRLDRSSKYHSINCSNNDDNVSHHNTDNNNHNGNYNNNDNNNNNDYWQK